jgi:hypothetical protein
LLVATSKHQRFIQINREFILKTSNGSSLAKMDSGSARNADQQGKSQEGIFRLSPSKKTAHRK